MKAKLILGLLLFLATWGHAQLANPRTDSPAETRSVKEWGPQCDTLAQMATATTSGGVSTLNTSNSFLNSNYIGALVIGVGTFGGLPAWFEDPIASILSGTQARLTYALPFDVTAQQLMTIGHDDSAGFNAATAYQLLNGGSTNVSLSIPVGNCLIHHTTQTPNTLFGRTKSLSQLTGFPGEPVLVLAGGTWQQYKDFRVNVNRQIDSTRPYNYFDTAGTEHAGTIYYQPFGIGTGHANNPCGTGWFIGCISGVGRVNSSSPTVLRVTSAKVPAVGNAIVFPNPASSGVAAVFTTTVRAVSGSTVTLAASYPGATTSEVEFFAGTSPQTITTTLPATGHAARVTSWSSTGTVVTFQAINGYRAGQVVKLTGFFGDLSQSFNGQQVTVLNAGLSGTQFKFNLSSASGTYSPDPGFSGLTVNLSNPIYPTPAGEWDFAGHGAVKFGAEECTYEGIDRTAKTLTLTQCGMNGTSESAHTGPFVVIPMNAWKWDAMQWPVTPTIHAGTATPVNAEYFPAGVVGAYGIGLSQYDGTGGAISAPFEAHFENLLIAGWPYGYNNHISFGQNNDASFFWAGPPYEDHFTNIDMYDESCFIEGSSAINTHAWNSNNPTGDGTTTDTMSCRASFDGAVADIISGGLQSHKDWATYGGTGGMGFNLSHAWDDQTGQTETDVYSAHFFNIYEEIGGVWPFGEVRSELDCQHCDYTQISVGGLTYIGGSFPSFYSANMITQDNSQPWVNWATEASFYDVIGLGSDVNTSNTWGTGAFLNYGANVHGCRDSGSEGCVSAAIGAISPRMGQTGETFSTGNYTAPYTNSLDGLITGEFVGGWTFDDTAPITHSGWFCGHTAPPNFGNNCIWNTQFIGDGVGNEAGKLAPGLYDVQLAIKQLTGANQRMYFQMHVIQSGTPGAPICASPNTLVPFNGTTSVFVPLTTSWDKVDLGTVDLKNYTGCQIQIDYQNAETTPTTSETSYFMFSPVWENPRMQKLTLNGTTWTSGSTAPAGSCNGGSIYTNTSGSPHTLYVCQSGTWVGK
jgi:hypothetical protein